MNFKKTSVEDILFFIIIMMLFIGSLNNINIPFVKVIGFISLLTSLSLGSFIFLYKLIREKSIYKNIFLIICASIPFILIEISGLLLNSNGVSTTIQSVLLILFMLYFSTVNLNEMKIKFVKNILFIFILFHFVIWIGTGFSMFFESIYSSSNLVGVYLTYSIIFLLMIRHKVRLNISIDINIILGLILIFASSTRSVILVLLIFIIIYYLWPILTKNILLYNLFFILNLVLIFSIIYFYPQLPNFKYFHTMENWMLTNFQKSLMSGRETIWLTLFDIIAHKPVLGYGTGITNSSISSISQSSHNLYIQLIVQTGLLGLATFVIFLNSIWIGFWKNRNKKIVKFAAATLIGTLIYQCFEITLTQNIVSIGALQFCIIGFGLKNFTNED